jgi:voltage-gated potassium channel
MSIIGRLRLSLVALGLVTVGGTLGYHLMGYTALEALYQTVITISTVGFREVRPLSPFGQVFTIVLILVGVGTALYTFTILLETFIEGSLFDHFGRRRMERHLETVNGHVIICGWGRVGRSLARQLEASELEVVVIDTDVDRLETAGPLWVEGDATSDRVLLEAGIDRARALVAATDTDAANLFITLSARNLNSELFIVTRARVEESEAKLKQAGASRVVNPQSIGGARMAAFVEQPHVMDFFDVVMHDGSLEFRLEEIRVSASSPLAGVTLRDAEIRGRTGALVLALRDLTGKFITNPNPDEMIAGGEVLIAIGTAEQLRRLSHAAGAG